MKLFFGTNVTYAGVVVPSGSTVVLILLQNAVTTDDKILANTRYSIPIVNGSFSQEIYFNDEMNPTGTQYSVEIQVPNVGVVYKQNIPITGASFDLATWVPVGNSQVVLGVKLPTFETNGTINAVQDTLNLVAGSNINITADAFGDVTFSASAATSLGFQNITTGTNTTATMTVGTGGAIVAGGGVIDATELSTPGAPVNVSSSAPTHAGQLLLSQPGNTTAIWADPQIQGLYAVHASINTPPSYVAPTTIQPVLIGGSDYAGTPLLQNLKVDSSGSLYIGGSVAVTIAATVTVQDVAAENSLSTIASAITNALSPAEPRMRVCGAGIAGQADTDVVTVQGIAGGVAIPVSLTSTTITSTVAVTQSTSPWVVQDSAAEGYLAILAGIVTSGNAAVNLAQVAGSTVATSATGVQKVGMVGNAGATVDAAPLGTAPTNGVQELARAATTFPTSATDGQTVVPAMDHAGKTVVTLHAVPELVGNVSVQTTDNSSHTLIGAGTSNVYNHITFLMITNETTTAAIVSLSDGTVTYKFNIAGVVGAGGPINFGGLLKATSSATNWTVQASANATLDYVASYIQYK